MWKTHIHTTVNRRAKVQIITGCECVHWSTLSGARLMLPLMACFTEVAPGMLTFSMLHNSGQAWQHSHLCMCVHLCVPRCHYPFSREEKKTNSSIQSNPVMNRVYIFMFLPENTWNTRGVKVKSGEVFGPFSIFPPSVPHRTSEGLLLYNNQVTRGK